MNLTTEFLFKLNETSKFLKNRDIAFLNGALIGLDNADVYVSKVRLPDADWFNIEKYNSNLNNPDKYVHYSTNYNINFVCKQRELSNFIKNLTTEKDFYIDAGYPKSTIYTKLSNVPLDIITSRQAIEFANERLSIASTIDTQLLNTPLNNIDITSDLDTLFEMKKTDGMYHYIFNNTYYITLFSGLLPLNKKDRLFLSILDVPENNYFTAKFRVKKPNAEVYVYINYLKIPSRVLV